MQLQPPSVTPFAPAAAPESQYLAQALAAMRTQPQTLAGGTADMTADALNTFGQQAKGQGGENQWLDDNGNPSGNWFNSRLGRALTGQPQAPGQQPYGFGGSIGRSIGGLFGLGQAAQGQTQAPSPNGPAGGGFGGWGGQTPGGIQFGGQMWSPDAAQTGVQGMGNVPLTGAYGGALA